MAPIPVEHLVRDLSRVASASAVRRAARRCGAVQRKGIVDIHALLMTVVLGVSVRGRASSAELRRVYGEVSGVVLARSSFYDRFNEGLAVLLKWLLEELMANSRDSTPGPPGALACFKDVLCEDATIFQLPDEMAKAWPSPRTNSAPAAAKVHARVHATIGELVKVKVTHGRVADCNAFGVGHELRNTLLLFDQGYSSQSLWRRVDSVRGYLITRLPADRDPVIVGHLRRHRGRARKHQGPPPGTRRRPRPSDGRFWVTWMPPRRSKSESVASREAGVQGSFQENVYNGYSLIPNHRALGGGLFIVERLSWHEFELEAGARHDRLHRSVWFTEDDFGRHERRGTLDPADCDASGVRIACSNDYGATSLSLGGLWRVVPDTAELKLDLSSASRAPNADELYLIGSAPSFPVFGLGSPDLGVETTWGSSLTGALTTNWVDAEISGYANLSRDFIYFAPDLNDSGDPRFEVTIRGTWPQYASRAIDARFVGTDGRIQVAPTSLVGLDLSGSIVRATDADTGTFLIGTPADRGRIALVGRPMDPMWGRDTAVSVHADVVAKQTRTDPDIEFAPPPDGYVLLGASAEVTVPVRTTDLSIGISGNNLTNVAYRDYTSLLRFFADQPGRDLRLRLAASF